MLDLDTHSASCTAQQRQSAHAVGSDQRAVPFDIGRAGRVAPDAVMDTVASGEALSTHTDAPAASDSIDFADGDDPSVKAHWALLVAGSAGWGNYRHQADVYHAYQILRNGGYQQDHIVVMAYDDIANNPENPMPGKVFNRPGGATS